MAKDVSRLARAPIGVFDSGLGGLSILREVARELPGEDIVYFGDTAHLPYGPRTLAEVRGFSFAVADSLIALPVKLMIIACNTASAAALRDLREAYPDFPFVGMEPAVKPAAAGSKTGKVGVLATRATFQGELFESVVERFAGDAEVLCQVCSGLAEFIERHPPDHPDLFPLLRGFIDPLRERGVDSLVLGCTHYPLVKDAIRLAAGPGITVVDPSPAIARRTRALLAEGGLLCPGEGRQLFYCSANPDAFSCAASRLLGREVRAETAYFSRPGTDGKNAILSEFPKGTARFRKVMDEGAAKSPVRAVTPPERGPAAGSGAGYLPPGRSADALPLTQGE